MILSGFGFVNSYMKTFELYMLSLFSQSNYVFSCYQARKRIEIPFQTTLFVKVLNVDFF